MTLTDTGMTVRGLTPQAVDTAAHDLKNAAMVIRNVGHFQGALCDRNTGALCVVGAIEVSTYKRINTTPSGYYMTTGVDGYWLSESHNRAEAAVVVLAEVVPVSLCKECDDDRIYCECGTRCSGAPREPWEKVTHYNDKHCPGTNGAIEVLRMAAEFAGHLANEKRDENLRVLAGV